jgi:hypothetical protein
LPSLSFLFFCRSLTFYACPYFAIHPERGWLAPPWIDNIMRYDPGELCANRDRPPGFAGGGAFTTSGERGAY